MVDYGVPAATHQADSGVLVAPVQQGSADCRPQLPAAFKQVLVMNFLQ
jgi:hypothetical protein